MVAARTARIMSPKLLGVANRSRQERKRPFNSLAHHITVDLLRDAYRRLRKDAARGVDGLTKQDYGRDLEANLKDLHERLKSGRYRHQPIRRVHIPKAPGKTRPIGISTIEDKIVQTAVRDILEVVYEPEFSPKSYGFRPGRSAHDAIRDLRGSIYQGGVKWVLEADIRAYFDSIDRKALMEMLTVRIADTSLLRLVGKCLHVGVLDGEQYEEPDRGTAQGSTLSPMLGNIYMHYVLDTWFESEVRPRMRGRATLCRFADDFVIGFETREDAERVQRVLGKRMAKFGLDLHPDKTRLVQFDRPGRDQGGGKGPGTFDFLGFTFFWRRTRAGWWAPWLKTRSARLHSAEKAINDYCRSHRHLPMRVQHEGLCRRIRGHMNYFAVQGNSASLALVVQAAQRVWFKWLSRRSQKTRMTWKRFGQLIRTIYPLPRPRISVMIWS